MKKVITAGVLICLLWLATTGNSQMPKGWAKKQAATDAREGYAQSFEYASGGTNDTILTVSAGKEFVLLKVAWTDRDDDLTVDENLLIDFSIFRDYVVDFPDGCVVVYENEALNLVKSANTNTHKVCIIGYYRDESLP